MGGGTREQCGNKGCAGWSGWLVMRGGGGGRRWGAREGGGDGGARELVTRVGGGRVREWCGSSTRVDGSEVERVEDVAALKTYGRVGGPGLEKGEGRAWGHQDTRDVGAERQIKKKVQMRGNGEGAREPAGRRPQGSAD